VNEEQRKKKNASEAELEANLKIIENSHSGNQSHTFLLNDKRKERAVSKQKAVEKIEAKRNPLAPGGLMGFENFD